MSFRRDSRIAEYQSFPVSCDCSTKQLRTLIGLGTRLDAPTGRVIAHQGTLRREFVVVIAGRADVVRDGCVVARLGPGDHTGEFTLLLDNHASNHPQTLHLSASDSEDAVRFAFDRAHLTVRPGVVEELTVSFSSPLPDPDDAPFLAVAAASASVLVTGNLRHFPTRSRRDVVVLTPREFIENLKLSKLGGEVG